MVGKREIWKFALRNSIMHGGKAQAKAVLSNLLATYPEMRPEAKEVKKDVEGIVGKVNKLPLDSQKWEAEKLSVDYQKKSKEEKKELPELPGSYEGSVITRAAPNPNGPIHLGNARINILSYLYAKKFNGRFVLRYDDTDPKLKKPENKFYEWILEDLNWLGCKPDLVFYASDRMNVYYEIAYDLLEKGKAYVCTCEPKEWKELKDKKKSCPCRDLGFERQKKRWYKLFDEYKEGEAVLRIKTDIRHKNPAVRDWPGLRIIEDPQHPRTKNEYRVWPLYNFASAIDDHNFGITHIIRGQEHSTNTEKQKFLYNHLGWKYPYTKHVGRVSIKGTILSTSKIKEGLEKDRFQGWDDPNLGTVKALRRKGFQPEAIKKMIRYIGLKTSDTNISMDTLSNFNRKIMDKKANRYFFVRDPVKTEIKNPIFGKKIKLPLHPEKKKTRGIKLGKRFFIDEADYQNYHNKTIRLKELCNIKLSVSSECMGNEIKKDMPKIQWVPEGFKINVKVIKPSGTDKGVAEQNLENEKVGSVVQFERYGFVRIDKKQKNLITCYFTHP